MPPGYRRDTRVLIKIIYLRIGMVAAVPPSRETLARERGSWSRRALERGGRLHRLLVGELAAAGCFRPAPLRSVAYGAFILAGCAGAYAALLSQSGAPVRSRALGVGIPQRMPASRARSGARRADAQPRDRRGRRPGLQHASDRALLFVLLDVHRLHHPHCNERARPRHAVGVLQHVRAVGARKAGPRQADHAAPGRC